MKHFSEEQVGRSIALLCLVTVMVLFVLGSRNEEAEYPGSWSLAFVEPFGSDTDIRLTNHSPSQRFVVSVLVEDKVLGATTVTLSSQEQVMTLSPRTFGVSEKVLTGKVLIRVTDDHEQTREIWKTLTPSL